MRSKEEVLTSVYLNKNLNDSFKIHKVIHKMSLKQIVEFSMYKYLTDESFRILVQTTVVPEKFNLAINISDDTTMPPPAQIPATVVNLDPKFLTQPFPSSGNPDPNFLSKPFPSTENPT